MASRRTRTETSGDESIEPSGIVVEPTAGTTEYVIIRGDFRRNYVDREGNVRTQYFGLGSRIELRPDQAERLDPKGEKFRCVGIETRPWVLRKAQEAAAEAEVGAVAS